jgi:hypothetical protein
MSSRRFWKAFPDLEEAHAALRLAEEVVPQDERNSPLAFGGLPEVTSAVSEIERFLASPYR